MEAYYCQVCSTEFNDSSNFKRHTLSERHNTNIKNRNLYDGCLKKIQCIPQKNKNIEDFKKIICVLFFQSL